MFCLLVCRIPGSSPHVHCNLFLAIPFQQWDLLLSLGISYDAHFDTKHPSTSAQGSSPWSSLLCSLIYPDNATINLMKNSWLPFCILKILCTWVFTYGGCYFQCVLLLCPPILSFPLDVSEVTQIETVASSFCGWEGKSQYVTLVLNCQELVMARLSQIFSTFILRAALFIWEMLFLLKFGA